MKAVICTRYGPPEVLQLREAAMPVHDDRDVLIKVRATAATSSDCFVRSGVPFAPLPARIAFRAAIGFARPRNPILGLVLAGTVEHIGKSVARFHVNDRVFAFTQLRFGAYAEYATLPESAIIALAPTNVGYQEAAAIPYGGLLALYFLRKGKLREGQRALVYGASGAVGTSAVQIAKHLGAHVTAVCGPDNLELVGSLGADAVLDYTTQHVPYSDVRYDCVFDAVGKRKTSALKTACREALAPGGVFVSVDAGSPRITARDLELLRDLVESGEIKPVIDRCYPLEQIAAAHEYVERGHKKGNVVIAVSHD